MATLQPGNAGAGPSNAAGPFAALRRAVGAERSGAVAAPGRQAIPYQQQLEEWERSAPAGEEAGRREAVERTQRFRPKFLETTTLDLSRLGLTTVPPLPKKIESLDLSYNNFTSLPGLPKRLISLTAANCRLTTLGPLPPKLRGLNINHNYLGTLPTLPETLTWLYADYNFLNPQPTLPYKLRHCHFAHNLDNECTHDASLAPYVGRLIQWVENAPADETESRRRAIGKIIRACDPSGLSSLDLSRMSLTTLPDLPAGLRSLTASDNQLTALPELPAGLIGLYADNNLLTTLPELPIYLWTLEVSSNPLVAPPLAALGADAAKGARRWQLENRTRATAQACLPPLRRPFQPLPIGPNAACSVPKDPPEWIYQRVGNWLWSYYTGNQFDALAPARKIDRVMTAVSGLNAALSERISLEKFQLGHRNLSAREALAYALEIAIESKLSAVPAISRRMLQLHPQQPDTFPLFGIDFTRKRIAEWAHNLNCDCSAAMLRPE